MNSTCIGTGSDSQCERGKCKIGTVTATTKKNKWRFDSATVPGLYYYVFGTDSITLKSVVRGSFVLPAGQSAIAVTNIASIPTTIYLPPNSYSEETFVRRVITVVSGSELRGIKDSANDFVRELLQNNLASVAVEDEVRNRVENAIVSSLDKIWADFVLSTIATIWSESGLTNRDFLLRVYEEMSVLYRSYLQVGMSSVRFGRLNTDPDQARPVYNRLPGISGAYNSEDNPDNPSKWLVSGVDSYLSFYKNHLLDRFYSLYLDYQTCYPGCLDWIGQHLGYSSEFWKLSWDSSIKRALIANAHVNRIQGQMWQTSDTLKKIDLSVIETINANSFTGVVTTQARHFKRQYYSSYQATYLTQELNLTVSLANWNGILPGKGSLTTLMVLFSIFNIKAVSGEELKYNSDGTYSVKSGLRQYEVSAPINTPYMVDNLRVGTETDSEVGNFPNQLVADLSRFYDDTAANTVVIRMPFYYNRNGRTWNSVQSIVDNFVPTSSVSRVQYAYSAADLMVAGDYFFEPIID